eukprot:m.167719 g.167719  ORF g.167719 m.167719 type:complete len:440 (+) comp25057_c0_seq2:99-1418(+)
MWNQPAAAAAAMYPYLPYFSLAFPPPAPVPLHYTPPLEAHYPTPPLFSFFRNPSGDSSFNSSNRSTPLTEERELSDDSSAPPTRSQSGSSPAPTSRRSRQTKKVSGKKKMRRQKQKTKSSQKNALSNIPNDISFNTRPSSHLFHSQPNFSYQKPSYSSTNCSSPLVSVLLETHPFERPTSTDQLTCTACRQNFTSISEIVRHTCSKLAVMGLPSYLRAALSSLPIEPPSLNVSPEFLADKKDVETKTERETLSCCDDCTAKFNGLSFVKWYRLRDDLPPDTKCDACQTELSDPPSSITFSCSLCPQVFNTPRRLKAHQHRHYHEQTHQCSHCSRTFFNHHCLKAHELTHGDVQLVCTFCHSTHATPRELRDHLQKHHLFSDSSLSLPVIPTADAEAAEVLFQLSSTNHSSPKSTKSRSPKTKPNVKTKSGQNHSNNTGR